MGKGTKKPKAEEAFAAVQRDVARNFADRRRAADDARRDREGQEAERVISLAQAVAQREEFNAKHRASRKSVHTPAERLARVFGGE